MYLVWKYAQFDGLNHPDTVYEIDRKVSCSLQTLQIPQHGPDGCHRILKASSKGKYEGAPTALFSSSCQ